ncbi:MAG: ABC transporter ATP-binding protein [Actinobacteria bacterium]|nr:ABC transporter ATP-binding protein [Actinomycetota bacterium]MBI3688461.1 ABC transporter ATP-binding protein [Actinomycetota bacterium]
MNSADSSPAGLAPAHRALSLWRLRPFVQPYLGHLTLMTTAALLATLAGAVLPLVTRQVIDGPIRHHDRGAVIPLGLLALGFGLVEAVLVFLRRWTMSASALRLESDLRQALYRHLQRMPISFHDHWQSGQVVARTISDLSQIRRFIGFGLIFMVVNSATFVIVGTMLIITDPPLGLLVLACSAPLAWIMYRFETGYRSRSRRVQEKQGDLATLVEESSGGMRTIKAFGRRDLVQDRFHDQATRLRDLELGKVRLLAMIWAIVESQPQLLLAAIMLAGSYPVVHGTITLGTLVAFVALFLLLVWPIESMGWLLATAQEASTATDRVFEVLDAEPAIVDRPHPMPLVRSTGLLRFHNVGFTYPGAARPVLHGINLTIEPGETLALVGSTGAGKTSLAMLVPRLYDVTSGRITLDRHDIRDIRLTDLRRQVGMAFEEPTLFSASVRENLTFGLAGATDDQVAEALEVAQAGFVHELPWGLATRVGEQGLTLSGGQRQRLALARAVLGRPPLVVLDDPLSALDVHTEARVERALRAVLAGTTGLVVAHRASTVLLADRVALLVDGTIAAVGSHHDLLAGDPVYRNLLSAEAELGAAS